MSQSHMSQNHKIEKTNEIKGTGFDSSVFTGESAEPSMNTGTVICKRIALMFIVHGIKRGCPCDFLKHKIMLNTRTRMQDYSKNRVII